MVRLTKLELIKMIEPCNDDAEIIIQNEGSSISIESGECLDVDGLEIYQDTVFILISKVNHEA